MRPPMAREVATMAAECSGILAPAARRRPARNLTRFSPALQVGSQVLENLKKPLVTIVNLRNCRKKVEDGKLTRR